MNEKNKNDKSLLKTVWLTIPFLIALVILPRLSVDLYIPSLPSMVKSFNTDDNYIQMTMTVFMFGYAFSMLIAGPLSDSLGRKKVMFYGLILYIISSLACIFSYSIAILIVARFFQALGGCCGTVVARVMVKDFYSKDDQINILAHLSSAMAICPLIMPMLGGVMQEHFGWRSVFVLLAIFSFFILVIGEKEIVNQDKIKEDLSLKVLINNYKMLLSNKFFLGYSLAIGFAWSAYFAFTVDSPFILQKVLGLNSIQFGMVFSLVVVGYLIGTRITRIFANKIGWDKCILIAALISTLSSIVMMVLTFCYPNNWYFIAFPMIFVMCGVGIVIPCTQAAVMQPFPNIAGTASGLFFFIQMLFGGFCGLLMQIMDKSSSLPMTIVILASSLLLLVSFYMIIWKRQQTII